MNTHKLRQNITGMSFLVFFLSASTVFGAVEWPWEQAAAQKTKGSTGGTETATAPLSSAAPAMAGSNLKSNLSKTETAPNDEFPAGTTKPSKGRTSTPLQSIQKAVNVDLPKSFTIKAPTRNANYEEAVKMQAKLNDLIHITTEMERLNRSKIAAVQSMVDQARVHEKKLAELASPNDTASTLRKSDADQILLNKKLRAMREEAEQQIAAAASKTPTV